MRRLLAGAVPAATEDAAVAEAPADEAAAAAAEATSVTDPPLAAAAAAAVCGCSPSRTGRSSRRGLPAVAAAAVVPAVLDGRPEALAAADARLH